MKKLFKKILVPVDLSPVSKQLILEAGGLAAKTGAELVLLNVVEPMYVYPDNITALPLFIPLLNNNEGFAKRKLAEWSDKLKVSSKIKVVLGAAPAEIKATAKREKADLILIGNQGKGIFSRIFLGSISDAVAREATQPVWVMKGNTKKLKKILVPMDGSKASLQGLKMACDIAAYVHAKVQPVSVVGALVGDAFQEAFLVSTEIFIDVDKEQKLLVQQRKAEMEGWTRSLHKSGTVLKPMVLVGDPKNVIPQLAKKLKADLLVLSPHSSAKPGVRPLGRVAARILHHSPCSVLVIRER